ncbi:MAG: dockerin type I domain-containing protein [Saprospiraceae bacterium]
MDINCCDAGLYVTVQLRVLDQSGNADTCWTEVLVRDNSLPFCTGLIDQTISCNDLPVGFDPYNTDILTALFGSPVVQDNCSATSVELSPVVALDDCGAGTVTRRFIAVDRVGNESVVPFEQKITIDYILEYHIRFPQDLTTDCLEAIPMAEAYNTGCDSITITYEDVFLTQTGNECRYIERTYTVTNWCEWNGITPAVIVNRDENCNGVEGEQDVWAIRMPGSAYIDKDAFYDNNIPAIGERGFTCTGSINPLGHWRQVNSTGRWQYTQRIKIFDNTAPVVTYPLPAPFCTEDAGCEAMIDIPFHLEEYCLQELVTFDIRIDINGNGTSDINLPVSEVLYQTVDSFHIRTAVPVGSHRMVLQVVDACGNTTVVNIPFSVADCYLPEVNCFSGLIAQLEQLPAGSDVNADGILDEAGVEIFATQLVSCNLIECNLPLRFSVNRVGELPNIDQQSIWLTCEDRPGLMLEVYTWDSAFNPYAVQPDGTVGGPNYTVCQVEVDLVDLQGYCNDCEGEAMMLGGDIFTMAAAPIAGVTVHLEATVNESMVTSNLGKYSFEDLLSGETYTIRPYKNDDTSNGITTIDMIRIQNHLLGNVVITSPYLLIAADVNNSGSVTTLDMIQLRRLILGDITTFANNTSWRFIPADYEFPNPLNPWAETFPEYVTVSELEDCLFNQHFIGIKIGDLNGSAIANVEGSNGGRVEGQSWNILMEDAVMKAGQTYRITLSAPDIEQVSGFQFALDIPTDKLALVSVEEGLLTDENLGKSLRSRGILTVSWNESSSVEDEVLCVLVVKSLVNANASDLIEISTSNIQAEAYEKANDDQAVPLVLFAYGKAGSGMALYQNVPNPVTNHTVIPFELPVDGEAIIEIHDLSGRRMLTIKDFFDQGVNEVRIKRGQLPDGLYVYTLRFGGNN